MSHRSIYATMLSAFAFAMPALAVQAEGGRDARPPMSVWDTVVVGEQTVSEQLATVDLQRYIAQVTGRVPRVIRHDQVNSGPAIFIGTPASNPRVEVEVSTDLGAQGFFIKQLDGDAGIVAGGLTPQGAVNAIYGLLREVGFGFYLGSEAVPESLPERLPEARIVRKPVLAVRGVLPWYNFFNSPTTWDSVDHRAFVDQLIRMGANFVGFHTYDSEPFAAYEQDGKMQWGGRLLSTSAPTWGTRPMPTSQFAFGTNSLFAGEFFGAATSLEQVDDRTAIQREQAIMCDALDYAHKRGLQTCLGFEITGDPTKAVNRDVFIKRVEHILNQYPALDYVWIWQPETQGAQGFREAYNQHILGSSLEKDSALRLYGMARRDVFKRVVERHAGEPPFFQDNEDGKIARAIEGARLEQFGMLAHRLLSRRENPPKLIISGWGGDERLLSADYYDGLDKLLPKDVIFASLDHIVPRPRVDRVYHELPADRQRWPIPWLEYDGDQWHPQPYVHVYEAMFKDIVAGGSQGVLGIHWRTREVEENFGYLVAASWQPDLTADAFFGDLARRCYPQPIAAEMAGIHSKLDAMGYRWIGGGGQGECGPFSWGPGDPAKVKELSLIRERVVALMPQAGRSAGRVQWVIDRIDWVLAFQEAQISALTAREMLLQAQAASPEQAKKLAADALARLDDGSWPRAFQAYARRVTTRGEYGVLATVNTKAVAAWRDVREQCCRILGKTVAEPGLEGAKLPEIAIPRLYGSTPAQQALQVDFVASDGDCACRFRTLGSDEWKKAAVSTVQGNVRRIAIGKEDVVAPGLEIEPTRPSGLARSVIVTVMPDLGVETKPRQVAVPEPLPEDFQLEAREGTRLPVELTWSDSSQADYFKVYQDGQLMAETAVAFAADAPGQPVATYTIEAWREDRRVVRSEPLVVNVPDHAITESPKLSARVTNAGVILSWPAASSPYVVSYTITRLPADAPMADTPVLARVAASASGEHVFRDCPPLGKWKYIVAPANAASRTGPAGEVVVEFAPKQTLAPVVSLTLTEKPVGVEMVGNVQFSSEGAHLGDGYLVLQADKAFSLAGAMTLCFEFKAKSVGDMPVLLCSGQWQVDGWFAQILGNSLVVRTGKADAQGPPIEPGRWYRVQFVYDGAYLDLYIDGKHVGQSTQARPLPGARRLLIGQYDQVDARYAFHGFIRNVKIYSDAVTPEAGK